jgi:glutamate racemase
MFNVFPALLSYLNKLIAPSSTIKQFGMEDSRRRLHSRIEGESQAKAEFADDIEEGKSRKRMLKEMAAKN